MTKIPGKKILQIIRISIAPVVLIVFAVLLIYVNGKSMIHDFSKTTKDGWKYVRLYDSDEKQKFIVVTGYESKKDIGELKIPAFIEDLPVRVLKGHFFDISQKIGKLVIPYTVQTINGNCFEMADIDQILFEEGSQLKTIEGRMALSSKTLEELRLPDSLETIGVGVFAYCFNLKTLYIGPNVKEIGDGSFWATDDLEEIIVDPANEWFEVKDGLLIDKSESKVLAYEHKKSTNEITIPADIKEIDDETLDGALSRINVEDGNEFYTSINGCLYTKDGKKLCRVPGKMELEDFAFADGVEEIGDFSFRNCFFDEEIVIPDSVKLIDFWAFDRQKLFISKNLQSADLQGFTGSIYFKGSKADWEKISIINAFPEDTLEYDLYFKEN